jgi:hypothetical protein
MFSFLKKSKSDSPPSKPKPGSGAAAEKDVNRVVEALRFAPDNEVRAVEEQLRSFGPIAVNALSTSVVVLNRGGSTKSPVPVPPEVQKERLTSAMVALLSNLQTAEILDVVRRDLREVPFTDIDVRYLEHRAAGMAVKVLMERGEDAIPLLIDALSIERERPETRLFAIGMLRKLGIQPSPDDLFHTAIADPEWMCRWEALKYVTRDELRLSDFYDHMLIRSMIEEISRLHKGEGWSLERIESTFYSHGSGPYQRVVLRLDDPATNMLYEKAMSAESYVREFLFRYVLPTLTEHKNPKVSYQAKSFLLASARSSSIDRMTRQMAKDCLASMFGRQLSEQMIAGNAPNLQAWLQKT